MLSNHMLVLIHQNIHNEHLIFFTTENEKDNRKSFLDLKIIPEQGTFTFAEQLLFLPSNYKIGLNNTFLHRCSRLCSNWTKFHLKLVWLMDIFKKNGYTENFINNCFKRLITNIEFKKKW